MNFSKLVLLIFVLIRSAHAEIENPLILPLGDRESLMGNSGVSVSGSAGNIFYNPAGLYRLTGKKFSASGSAYAYVKGRAKVLDDSVEYDSLVSVPNMVAATRRVGSWTLGFGIFSPIAFEGVIKAEDTISTGLDVSVESQFRTEEQYIGLASGKDIGNAWSFGVGIFLHRYVRNEITSFFATPNPTPVHLSKTERTKLEVLGLLPIIGVQKDFSDKLRFGLRIAMPDVELSGRSSVHSQQLTESGGTVTIEKINKESNGHYRLPFDIATGISWVPNGKHSVVFDLGIGLPTNFDSMPGLEKGDVYDTETVVRQNLGYEYRISDEFSLVSGIVRSPSSLGSTRNKDGGTVIKNNFFGANIGVYMREKVASSGLGFFWLNSRSKDVAFAIDRDEASGFQIYGATLTTSIEY